MSEQNQIEEASKIEVPEITSGSQAFLFITHGVGYFWKNNRGWTIVVTVITGFVISQVVTNFKQIKEIASAFGG